MEDAILAECHRWLEEGLPSKEDMSLKGPTLRHYGLCWSQMVTRDGVLFYRWEDPDVSRELRLLVPEGIQQDLIRAHHGPPTAGHQGPEHTLSRIRQHFYWYGMRAQVELYVRQCSHCATSKKDNRKRWAHMRSYHAGLPIERLHLDILGPFPMSTRGTAMFWSSWASSLSGWECLPCLSKLLSRQPKPWSKSSLLD